MNMRQTTFVAAGLVLACSLAAGAGEGRKIKKSALDHAVVYKDTVPKDVPIRIREFGTENADMGTGKDEYSNTHQVALDLKENAPQFVQEGALAQLRAHGFTDVAKADDDESLPDGYLLVEGEFTVLNPGNRAKRYFGGWTGAGKSRICAVGKMVGSDGELWLEFDHCRNQKIGVAGGNSKGQMTKDTFATGVHFAEFMDAWAQGRFVD